MWNARNNKDDDGFVTGSACPGYREWLSECCIRGEKLAKNPNYELPE